MLYCITKQNVYAITILKYFNCYITKKRNKVDSSALFPEHYLQKPQEPLKERGS